MLTGKCSTGAVREDSPLHFGGNAEGRMDTPCLGAHPDLTVQEIPIATIRARMIEGRPEKKGSQSSPQGSARSHLSGRCDVAVPHTRVSMKVAGGGLGRPVLLSWTRRGLTESDAIQFGVA
jgi:hypothetical protein